MQLELTVESNDKSHNIHFAHACDEAGWNGHIIVAPANGDGDSIVFPLNGALLNYLEAWVTANIENNKD